MDTILLPNDMQAVNQELIRKAAEVQSAKIVQPIFEYMKSYGLDRELSFLYKGTIRDVDIYSPHFERGLHEKSDDFEKIVFLLEKHGMTVPEYIRSMQTALKKQHDLRIVVSQFENWLVGHMAYLDLEGLVIETIFYAPHSGFLIKFEGLEPIKDVVENRPPINDIKVQAASIKDERKTDTFKSARKGSYNRKRQVLVNKAKHNNGLSPEEWKQQNTGYLWVQEQLRLGRPRKEIIYEFNIRHRKDPANFSSREGKELTAAILSHWAKKD